MRLIETLVRLPAVLPPAVAGVALLLAFGRMGLLGGWLASMGEDEAGAGASEEELGPKNTFTPGMVYNVKIQGPKRKKTMKDLVYEEVKTDADASRIAHVFKDPAGRTQIIDDDSIVGVDVAGNAADPE